MKQFFVKTAAVLTAVIIISGCGSAAVSREESRDAGMEQVIDKRINVRTAEAQIGSISNRLILSGDVEASSSVDVYPAVAGKITSLLIEAGDYVKKGQVLAKVDQARPGMNYAESPVEAPVSGTVTAVNADTGATVSQQMALFSIGNIDSLRIKTQVPERFIYMVEKGQKANISTTASPGAHYQALISSIAPVVNPASRTLSIELEITGRIPIKAGMFVGIELITSTRESAVILPEKAVLTRDEYSYVYRVSDNTAERVIVETGIKDNEFVEIISGIDEGDIVVTEGAALLSAGSGVKIINKDSSK